jgi:Na+-transporting NADH:ubiquinone oxidoreductase subunit C
VKVVKGGAAPGDLHGVDAVSGGTITSNGVTEMLKRTINYYIPYFKKIEQNQEHLTQK